MATQEQMDTFVEQLDRLGARGVAGALGFTGDHDDVELDENLLWAFEDLAEADAAQALRKLAMAR
jgi:hypothetical protein